MEQLLRGLIAGAAGTTALNAVTYLDMVVRGRPASDTPQQSAKRLADAVHVDLGDAATARNRTEGLGSLLGYATGAAVGVASSLAGLRRLPWPLSALVLGGTAMVVANAPMTAMRVTDPCRWTGRDWLADAVPHLAFGVVAAYSLHRCPAQRRAYRPPACRQRIRSTPVR
jgi:hypothetical protein